MKAQVAQRPDSLWVWLDDPSLGPLARLGTLSRGDKGVTRFTYEREWLATARAFDLDPRLQLDAGVQYAPGDHFGVFLDSCPDRWGQLLMRRREGLAAREQGRRPRQLDAWDFLLGVQDATRMGALRFSLPESERFLADEGLAAPPMARLAELQALGTELSRSDADDLPELKRWLAALLAPGSSLGGARPKANLMDDDGLWIAKFPAAQDLGDQALWEMLLRQLAQDVGVWVPQARLWAGPDGRHSFLSRRFDRQGQARRFFCSAMTLLEKADGEAGSYLDLAQLLMDRGDAGALKENLSQLYIRLLFNIATGNRDDHLRNHGFMRGESGWVLSPAYDMNPAFDKEDHALSLDGAQTRPGLAQALELAPYFRLESRQAKALAERVKDGVAKWPKKAQALGLRRADMELAQGHFLARL